MNIGQIGGMGHSLNRYIRHFFKKTLILSLSRRGHESIFMHPAIAPVQQAHMGPLPKGPNA